MVLTNPLDSLLWRKFFVFTRVAPLGIKFWDAVQNTQVVDGLIVQLRPTQPGTPPITATRTSSGVFAFQNVPGLRDLEFPRPGVAAPAPRSYVLSVQDMQGRFSPIYFTVDLPLPYRGVFRANGPETPGFLLFSAPTRSTTAEIGAVRAQLINDSTGLPAANAMLEVVIDTRDDSIPDQRHQAWYAIADERGMVAVLIPYPSFQASGVGAGTKPSDQFWDLNVHCFYRPSSLTALPGLDQPDLRAIVAQRSQRANFRFQDASTGAEFSQQLHYGADLTLFTRSATVGGAEIKTVAVVPSGALPIPGP